jgi:hypothetical protein
MNDQIPKSNADVIALNVVDHAIVDEINRPGEALAGLFLKMAAMAHDIGAEHSAAASDWHEVLANVENHDVSDLSNLVDRQALTLGDTWSKRWMLAFLAKHIYRALERACIQSPAAPAIARVEYENDGSLRSWTLQSSRSGPTSA